MVGLLAAAMGAGGIVGLILGLVAMMMIGKMMDKNGVANNLMGGEKKDEPNKGKGQSLKREGDMKNAVVVEEGSKVQMVKTDGTKKTYLSGQNEDGSLTYSEQPQDVTLLTRDKEGKDQSIIKGKMSGNDFFVEKSASVMPDGRMGPITDSTRMVQLDGDGNMDLRSPAVAEARKAGGEAAAAYAKPVELELKSNDGRVSMEYGKAAVDGKEYTAVATGTMSADGKKAIFDKALLKAGDEFVKGTDGKPIELKLPNQELDVLNGKVSPMTGDTKVGTQAIMQGVLGEQKKQEEAKENANAGRAKQAVDAVASAKGDKTAQEAVLNEQISKKLEELGIADPKQRALMTADIKGQYMDANFRAVPPEQARETVAGMVGSDERVKTEMGDFAARIQEGVRNAMGKTEPAAPAAAPVAEAAAAAVDAARGATNAGTDGVARAADNDTNKVAQTGSTGPAQQEAGR
jgi:hypothetical protein